MPSMRKRIGKRRKYCLKKKNQNYVTLQPHITQHHTTTESQPISSDEDDPLSNLLRQTKSHEPQTNYSSDEDVPLSSLQNAEASHESSVVTLQHQNTIECRPISSDEDAPSSSFRRKTKSHEPQANYSSSDEDVLLSSLQKEEESHENNLVTLPSGMENAVCDMPVSTNVPHIQEELANFDLEYNCQVFETNMNSVVSSANLDKLETLPMGWLLNVWGGKVQIVKLETVDGIPVSKVIITLTPDDKPHVKVQVHHKELPADHGMYQQFGQEPLTFPDVHTLVEKIEQCLICVGNPEERFFNCNTKSGHMEQSFGMPTLRAANCMLLIEDGSRCHSCSQFRNTLRANASRKSRGYDNPEDPSSHTALIHLNAEQLRNRLGARTQENKNLRQRLKRLESRLQESINCHGVLLNEETTKDLKEIVKTAEFPHEENSFASLFWEEQLKAAKCADSRAVRWHPMIIRWALSLKFKSSAAYETLRNSGCLKLPSSRTLRDYTNVFRTKSGFQHEVLQTMVLEKEKVTEKDMFVTILQDEIKLQSDLVFDKHTGELLGFVDLGNVSNSIDDFERELMADSPIMPDVATHMLVLMVRGLVHKFEFVIGHFPCAGIRSEYLFPIMWEAVERLELCYFKVLCITCDGATPNRKFFKIHAMDANTIIYKTVNPWAEDGRWLFFISDVPHLLKTARNCFSNSYGHKRSRGMWRNGQDISWRHIVSLYSGEFNLDLRLVPKLTRAHVYLTSFATMKVSYAAQVLSSSVANALSLVGGNEVSETVKFIRMFDQFFDCLNVRALYEGQRTRKEFLHPYNDVNDVRFHWLVEVFLADLKAWKEEVQNRQGNFSKADRSKMLLSYQTLEGIEITVRSFVESCKYILSQGAEFVLSERYNQDPLEQWFSLQRSSGGANDNPNVQQFNFNASSLRLQKSSACAPFTGNCKRNRENIVIDNTRLPKKKRHFRL